MSDADGTWIERAADRVVSLWDPRRAYVRQHFRRMDRDPDYRAGVEALMHASGYRKRAIGEDRKQPTPSLAHVGRYGTDPRSADAVNLLRLREDRAKSRALRRENALAAGLINGTAREVVGTGIHPQSLADSDGVRDRLEAVWQERCDELFPAELGGFVEAQRVMVEKLLEDGEVFLKPAATTRGEPVWFELLEADRVTWPLDASPADPQGSIRDGVERDRYGRIVAYHVSRWHPGDTAIPYSPVPGSRTVPLSSRDFERLPPTQCKHLALHGRPGASRGTPWLSPVAEDLSRMDLLVRASLDRVTMSACLAVFIETQLDMGGIVDVTAQEYGFEVDQALTPGMFFRLAPGEKMSSLEPRFPVTDIDTFVRVLARRIGTALGLSYLAVSYDASGYNYSSARTDMIRDRRFYRRIQHQLVSQALGWLWVTVQEDARLRGDVRLRGVTDDQIRALSWTLPTQEWVDPRNEGEAIAKKLDLGLTTLRDEAAALGRDWEDLLAQRSRERERVLELDQEHAGLPVGADSGDGAGVQDTALNGAQVTSLQQIVQAVAAGELPGPSAVAMLLVAFPTLTPESAAAIVDPAAEQAASVGPRVLSEAA